jgi:hypothetical protein
VEGRFADLEAEEFSREVRCGGLQAFAIRAAAVKEESDVFEGGNIALRLPGATADLDDGKAHLAREMGPVLALGAPVG